MTLMFVDDVMNVFWMAAIATLVLVEKTVRGHLVSRAVGAGLILGGWLLMLPMSSLGHVQTSLPGAPALVRVTTVAKRAGADVAIPTLTTADSASIPQ